MNRLRAVIFIVLLLQACAPFHGQPMAAPTVLLAPAGSTQAPTPSPTPLTATWAAAAAETAAANVAAAPAEAHCESRPGAKVELACTSAATGLHYWLYLPESPAGKKLPLILYLHGFSHSGSDLGKVLGGGPPLEIEAGRAPNAVIVSPQCPSEDIWPSAKMVERLSEFVKEMIDLYPVDSRRVTLTGFSMGGDGTWWLGVAHPELFAALAPVASWYLKTGELCTLKDMPIWDFQGEKDGIVNPEIARERARALESCGGSVKLTFYPDADHEQSSRLAYGTEALYEWLLKQTGEEFHT